jgi:hypothetical protein
MNPGGSETISAAGAAPSEARMATGGNEVRSTRLTGTRPGMTIRTLLPFLAMTFGLTWGIGSSFALMPELMTSFFGEMSYTNPLFILMVYAPGFAGLILVWRHYGVRGLGRYLRRLTMWRMRPVWWALLALGVPAGFYVAAAIKGTAGAPFPFTPWHAVIPSLLTALAIGPMEEFGWRGVALPLLQRRFAPFWADLVLAAVWAIWHMPSFFLSGTPQDGLSFGAFFIGMLAISMILCALFNASGGSILIAALFHFQLNNPIWPDAQPWDSVVFALIAIVVVILNRKAMFSREGGATEILA